MNKFITHNNKLHYSYTISEDIECGTFSNHTHNVYELIYFLDGDATHIIEDRKYKLKKGDVILIKPLKYHFIQIDSVSRYERIVVQFDDTIHNIDGLSLMPDNIDIINIENNSSAQEIFKRLKLYSEKCSDEMLFQILPHVVSELFYSIHLFSNTFSKEFTSLSPLVSNALQYINKNLCSITDIGEVSNYLFVSESYFFRLFKKELHQSPKKYILEKRLLLAEKMLSQGEKPTAVSEKCGFSDYTTFYRNFVSFFGHSPSSEQNRF